MAAVADSIDRNAAQPGATEETTSRRKLLRLLDVGVLFATLIVFLLFLFLLNRIVFPQGSRLGDVALRGGADLLASDEQRGFSLAGDEDVRFGRFVAQLGEVNRDVKFRPANSVAWTTAEQGRPVRDRDAIQTFANSRARVDFTTDNELRIGQNSLVIFSSGARDPFLERREPAAVVLEGELSGEINADYGAFDLQIPAGLVVLRSGSGADEVNFKVSSNADKSSTIAVYSGEADVNIAGEHFLVGAEQGITISENGRTEGVKALPAQPTVRSPRAESVASFRDLPPRVDFSWERVAGADAYRLELARDTGFEQILVDERLPTSAFTHANLGPGKYYWRVSARNGWIEGPVTKPRTLSVVRDTDPPRLKLQPVRQVAGGRFQLRGNASPDATIYVLGETVDTTSQGDFEYLFNAEPGAQTILVEAVDSVGNVAYGSQIFHVPNYFSRSD